MRMLLLAVFAALIALYGCNSNELDSGIDLSNMNKEIRPQDDFFRYVNGLWLDSFEIPAD